MKGIGREDCYRQMHGGKAVCEADMAEYATSAEALFFLADDARALLSLFVDVIEDTACIYQLRLGVSVQASLKTERLKMLGGSAFKR
jgi:hypothetical protein